ncbi:MAG: PilC/PilY family type IV pilus protein [Thermodesulfovibrionia bacterium]|nr:PilC/PilY family type IV pilus protein [Thermodesulfovibrionia bacterium]
MKKVKNIRYILWVILLCGVFFNVRDAWAPPVITDYTAYPPFVVGSSNKANVMILFSNDHTNYYKGYNDTSDIDGDGSADTTYKNTIEYYGYFDPDKCYTYSSSGGGKFAPYGAASNHYCTGNRWSGNFINWATMSHADFVRKALTGGKRDSPESVNIAYLLRANIYDLSHSWNKVYSGADINQLTPFATTMTFRSRGTSLYVRTGSYPDASCSAAITTDWAYGDTGANCVTTAPSNTYTVTVEVCNSTIPGLLLAGLEDNCKTYQSGNQTYYKPAGLIVRHADEMRFGLMTYSVGSYNDKGGILRRNVQDVVNEINSNGTINSGIAESIIRYINDFTYKGWDPVAEMYYEAIRYFKALAPTTTYRCGGGAPWTDDSFPLYCNQGSNTWTDPIQSYCQKNYIIIVNDEYPSRDHNDLPSSAFSTGVAPNDSGINTYNWTDSVGSFEGINATSQQVGNLTGAASGACTPAEVISSLANVTGICPSEPTAQGTFNIAGLAYYAHTQDLRTGNCGGAACTNSQTIKTYAIAFRASPGGYQIPGDMNGDGDFLDAGDNRSMNQLYLAAKYGGFKDKNNNGQFDSGTDEWDVQNNSTGVQTADGIPDNYFTAEKGADFENAMGKIISDILERESSGTSASVLATTGEGEGAIYQAYFVPEKASGSTTITWLGYVQGLFTDKEGNIREDTNNNDTLDYSGDYIIRMSYNTTTQTTDVYKHADTDGNGFADDTDGDGDVDNNDAITGSPFALSDIIPIWEAGNVLWSTSPGSRVIKTSILDTCTSTTCTTTTGGFIDFATANRTMLRPYLRASTDNEAEAIIRYIRGEDTPMTVGGTTYTYRSRTMTIGGTSNTWKLGDVVYSTPTAVTKPSENFDFIYGDSTYAAFKTQYLNRRHVVYAGANDGMLHAFNGGVFNTTTHNYAGSGYTLGQELFAFIPQSLLPHLKWLTDTNYTHVYYVDLKPKVVDARIFTADATHVNGWGTVLIGGMRLGGRDITYLDTAFSPNQKTFYSAYFALDITNPDATDGSYGRLLWVYTDTTGDLNMTSSYPAVARTGPKNPFSTATGAWHVVFGSGPTSYTGASTKSGKIYVLDLATGALSRRFDDQAVLMDNAFMADPITVDMDLDYQVDVVYIGNTYCPSGTGCTSSTWAGRMYRIATGEDTNTANWQVPSVLFNPQQPITSAPSVAMDEKADLWLFFGTGRFLDTSDRTLDSTERWSFYGIKDTCKPWINPTCVPSYTAPPVKGTDLYDASSVIVCKGGGTTCAGGTAWSTVLNNAASKTGWYVDFSTAGERTLFKPAVIGGLAVWTTYTPNTNACASEGTSNIYAAFYKTGTAYKEFVFDQTGTTATAVDRSLSLGTGLPSSVGIMVTGDNEMVGFVQQSTGTIVQIRQTTPFALKGEVIGWKRGLIP